VYRFPTTCSKAVCPHTAYQIVVGGATSECFGASGTGPDLSDPILSNNLLLDRPVQFYLDRAISICNSPYSLVCGQLLTIWSTFYAFVARQYLRRHYIFGLSAQCSFVHSAEQILLQRYHELLEQSR